MFPGNCFASAYSQTGLACPVYLVTTGSVQVVHSTFETA